jgi:hypothetical protein
MKSSFQRPDSRVFTRPARTSPADRTDDDYGPAYRQGVDAYARYPGRPFEEIECDLEVLSASRSSSKMDDAVSLPRSEFPESCGPARGSGQMPSEASWVVRWPERSSPARSAR